MKILDICVLLCKIKYTLAQHINYALSRILIVVIVQCVI